MALVQVGQSFSFILLYLDLIRQYGFQELDIIFITRLK